MPAKPRKRRNCNNLLSVASLPNTELKVTSTVTTRKTLNGGGKTAATVRRGSRSSNNNCMQ